MMLKGGSSIRQRIIFCRSATSMTCRRQLISTARPNPTMVDALRSPPDFDSASAVVYSDVITGEQESRLIELLNGKFRRRRYEGGHWDAVIKDYKEIELIDVEEEMTAILLPLRQLIQDNHSSGLPETMAFSGSWLPYCHAIDLKKDGELNAHVDSVRFSGNIVAGLSLLSSSIMTLKPEEGSGKETDQRVNLLLLPRSLYVLSGMSRYDYTHELKPSDSDFPGYPSVKRDRRLSIIFRDTKQADAAEPSDQA